MWVRPPGFWKAPTIVPTIAAGVGGAVARDALAARHRRIEQERRPAMRFRVSFGDSGVASLEYASNGNAPRPAATAQLADLSALILDVEA